MRSIQQPRPVFRRVVLRLPSPRIRTNDARDSRSGWPPDLVDGEGLDAGVEPEVLVARQERLQHRVHPFRVLTSQ